MSDPIYVPNDTDMVGLFKMDCPNCGCERRVNGNVTGIFLEDHETEERKPCAGSGRRVLLERMRR